VSCILVCLGPFFLLMPFFGEMNFFWMVALTTVVTVERLPSRWGEEVATATGVVALVAGVAVLLFQPALPVVFTT
jgi:predicted metal-binding membrane protein